MFALRSTNWQLTAAALAAAGTAAAASTTPPSSASFAGGAACEAAPLPNGPQQPRIIPAQVPRATAVSMAELRRWLEQRGADLSGVEIRRPAAAGGFGTFATPEAQRLTARGWLGWAKSWAGLHDATVSLASFPLSSALTAASVAALPGQGEMLSELLALGVVDERTAVMLHLAVERARGEESPLRPWLSALPAAFATPLYWADADLAWLQGTSLHRAVALQRKALQETWRRLEPVCRQLALSSGSEAEPTYDDLLWAYSTFWSRALAIPYPTAAADGGLPGVTMQEGIVPGLDFCNHDPSSVCRWTVFGGGRSRARGRQPAPPSDIRLVCPANSKLRQGQELTISYGNKSNEELLFLYGFVLEEATNDVLMVACPLPPPAEWDGLLRARVALLQQRGVAPQIFLPAADLARGEESQATQNRRRGMMPTLSSPSGGAGVAELDLPEGVMRTLEVFVMEPEDVKAELEAVREAGTATAPKTEAAAAAVEHAGGAEGRAAVSSGLKPREASSARSSGGETGSSGGAGARSTRQASAATSTGGRGSGGEMECSGLRMAVLTTLVRLLELKVLELESEESGTGTLAADERLLASSQCGSADVTERSGPGGASSGSGGKSVRLSPAQLAALRYRIGQKRLARGYLSRCNDLLARELRHLQALMQRERS